MALSDSFLFNFYQNLLKFKRVKNTQNVIRNRLSIMPSEFVTSYNTNFASYSTFIEGLLVTCFKKDFFLPEFVNNNTCTHYFAKLNYLGSEVFKMFVSVENSNHSP